MSSRAQETPLLGVCDGPFDPGRHRSSFLTNRVGGRPDWPPGVSAPAPRCAACGARLAHVVQVYCPLEASPYHRTLHLFACPGASCSGRQEGWTVLRSQALEDRTPAAGTPSRPAPPQEAPLAATDWCDAADDWGMEEAGDGWGAGGETELRGPEEMEEPEEPEEPAADPDVSGQLQALCLGKEEEEQEEEESPPLLRSFFISVLEESDLGRRMEEGEEEEEEELQHARQLLKEYERREGVAVGDLQGGGGGGGRGEEEQYEKTTARHGDAVFSRFLKKISLCPQQILRYSRGGEPLLVSEAQLGAPACRACGGSRTFELQLMPALVSLLQREGGGGAGGAGGGAAAGEVELEFGTVLVYTCRDSCWTDGSGSALEEFCLVQTDPDQQLFT